MLKPRERAEAAHLSPASSAGFGQEGFISPVHGYHLVGGVGPVGTPLANDGALMQTQLFQLHRRPVPVTGPCQGWRGVAGFLEGGRGGPVGCRRRRHGGQGASMKAAPLSMIMHSCRCN